MENLDPWVLLYGGTSHVKYLPKSGYRFVVLSDPCSDVVASNILVWEVVENWDWTSSQACSRIRSLHENYNFKRILFGTEHMVIPALMMNQILGLGGLPFRVFENFRDKGKMCQKMVRGGIKVPRFKSVESIIDIYEFASQEGYPFLIKPRLEAGAAGIEVIQSKIQLEKFCDGPFALGSAFLCQQKINVKTLYAVNGVVSCGEVRCCYPLRYGSDILTSFSAPGLFRHCIFSSISHKDPVFERLTNFTLDVTRAFEVPMESTFTYHLEVMETQERELFFCENACRVGGGVQPPLDWTNISLYMASYYGQLDMVHESIPKSLEEQPVTENIHSIIHFGVQYPATVKLCHLVDFTGLNATYHGRGNIELPFTPPSTASVFSGLLMAFSLTSKTRDQADIEIQELISRAEKACEIYTSGGEASTL